MRASRTRSAAVLPERLSMVIRHINGHVLDLAAEPRLHASHKPGSRLVRVEFPGHPEHDYLIKVRRPPADDHDGVSEWQDALRHEFDNLHLLQGCFPSWVRIPRPLYLDVENLLIAMSVVPGRPLVRCHGLLARSGLLGASQFREQLETVGRALRQFHAAPVERSPTASDHVLPRLRKNIDSPLLDLGQPTRRLLHGAAAELERLIDQGTDRVLSHNDVTMENVLVDVDGGIGLVDLDGVTLNRAEADLASMRLSLVQALAWLPAGPRRTRREHELWGAFVQGYGTTPPDPTLWPFLVWRAVNYMEDVLRRSAEDGLVRRLRLRRVASAISSWLAAAVSLRLVS